MAGWRRYRMTRTVLAVQMDVPFKCQSSEGTVKGYPGDYLVMNPATEDTWPEKKEVFESTYEQVSDEG